MAEKSLKAQAEEIMAAVDRDIQHMESSKTKETLAEVDSKANALMKNLFTIISDVDIEAAAERVNALKEKYPDASPEQLSQILIREKAQRTGSVGAVTSGAGLVPGLGTAAAMTLGVAADIGATFKLQAELVLEIAAAYDYPLTEQEKQQIVMLITGISAGTTTMARRMGQRASLRIGEKVAERAIGKTLIKALPVIGVIASAGTNVLSTYVIGQRADAYFRLGPESMGSWSDSLRTISGVDERNITRWLAESGKATGTVLARGAGRVGEVGKVAGGAVVAGAGRVVETTREGAQRAGDVAQTGLKAYVRWVITFWTTVFRIIWLIISFIPRKVMGLLGRKNGTVDKQR
jgi:hypothetical protein